MSLRRLRTDLLGGPLGVVLTGAALVSVALPMSRRMVRPIARAAIRQAYQVSNRVRQMGIEWRMEWEDLLHEATMESKTEEETVITQAWRDPSPAPYPEEETSYLT